jgi:hypothetical protein
MALPPAQLVLAVGVPWPSGAGCGPPRAHPSQAVHASCRDADLMVKEDGQKPGHFGASRGVEGVTRKQVEMLVDDRGGKVEKQLRPSKNSLHKLFRG